MTENELVDALVRQPSLMPPLELRIERRFKGASDIGADAEMVAEWDGKSWGFAAEFKSVGTPKFVNAAAETVRRAADQLGLLPMVVAPYLSESQLERLIARGVSGVDLCGNGVVQVPGELMVYRTGQPNKYPASTPIRKVYQGSSSLVPRAFLVRGRFDAVGDIQDEIERRGGEISLATVSKVLKTLDDDLMVKRDGRASRVRQPDALLDRLADAFDSPSVDEPQGFEWKAPKSRRPSLVAVAERAGVQLAVTGAASTERYAVMPGEPAIRFYCSDVPCLVEALGDAVSPAARFADLELLSCDDPTVYFDRRKEKGMPWSSPIQCWLELQAGDKRQRDAATTVRKLILNELEEAGGDR